LLLAAALSLFFLPGGRPRFAFLAMLNNYTLNITN
jgi:hypothetical protein